MPRIQHLIILAGLAILVMACRQPSPPELRFILVSRELAVEQTRMAFAILDRANRPVEGAGVHVEFLPPGNESPSASFRAEYRAIDLAAPPNANPEWYNPDAEVRGIYAIDDPPFSEPGDWQLHVSIQCPDMDSVVQVNVVVEVLEESSTPGIGARVSPIDHPTASDVKELSDISTSPDPIPAMHRTSVAEALEQGRPFLVVFATPAFCQSRICGPVVETVARLLPVYGDELEFIHIEPYDLDLIRGEGKLEPSKEARAWGLPSEPWVFLVDASGRLIAKFEGIVAYDELDEAVRDALFPSRALVERTHPDGGVLVPIHSIPHSARIIDPRNRLPA